jgi:chromosome partitioning protein
MTKIISIINEKGGVAKTTTTLNLGAGLGRQGKKVLLIDFDPQANLTLSAGIKLKDSNITASDMIEEFLTDEDAFDVSKYVLKKDFYHIIPSSKALASTDDNIRDEIERERILKRILENAGVNKYDYILIDCSPSLGLLPINALVASHSFIVPVTPETFAISGLMELVKTYIKIKKINKGLDVLGVLITRYQKNRSASEANIEILKQEASDKLEPKIKEALQYFKDRIFKTMIYEDTKVSQSQYAGEDLFTYDANSRVAKNYNELINEILKMYEI